MAVDIGFSPTEVNHYRLRKNRVRNIKQCLSLLHSEAIKTLPDGIKKIEDGSIKCFVYYKHTINFDAVCFKVEKFFRKKGLNAMFS